MGIFDKLKNSAMDTVMTAATSIGNLYLYIPPGEPG